MRRSVRVDRLKTMLKQLAPEMDLEGLARAPARGLEGMENLAAPSRHGLEKVLQNGRSDITDEEMIGLEAIVLREGRPVVFIRNGIFDPLPNPWTHLNEAAMRNRLQATFASIGRVELPNETQIPYGGTGFIVGRNMLMTNRHVAALFTVGLGRTRLRFTPGDAAIDFKRERGSSEDDRSAYLDVKGVEMIHPYWDMALLRVAGLPADRTPLRLSTARPEDLVNRDVVVVGYPALDSRNDIPLQNKIFESIYEVKRMQPGKLRPRSVVRSFESTVNAATHDSSTLGGNSGSAVIDAATGEVVALHFAGRYLLANYSVPTFELARDPRAVELGLNFTGSVPATGEFDAAWSRAEQESSPRPTVANGHVQNPRAAGAGTTWTVPLQVTVSFGTPTLGGLRVQAQAAAAPVAEVEARMQVPVIYPDLDSRGGYQPTFLALPAGETVPLPALTAAGKAVAAKLEGGGTELKYHHFSIVMHKTRRMAIFTASNVDWRSALRTVDGRKPTRRELTELDENAQEKWVTDPRIPDGQQLPDVFYTKDQGAFDKGHLIRRDDVAWGSSFSDIQKANGDTYHTTNCSPQVAGFNRPMADDNWGDLEQLIQRETKSERVCLFAGPVLHEDDRVFSGRDSRGPTEIQIPRKYWKIVVAIGDDGPRAYGFLLEQDLSDVPLEFAVPRAWKRFMVSIGEIEEMLNSWVKLTWLKDHDAIESEEGRRVATRARVVVR